MMDRENKFIQGLNNKTHREGGMEGGEGGRGGEGETKKERSIWKEKRGAGALRAPSSAQRERNER